MGFKVGFWSISRLQCWFDYKNNTQIFRN